VELGFADEVSFLGGLLFLAASARRWRRWRRGIMLQLFLVPLVLLSGAFGELASFCTGVQGGAASSFR
jgi:hypothetical protein